MSSLDRMHGAAGPADVELLDAARSDASAFGIFYDRHVEGVLAYFYRRVVCPHTAADLAAETFAHALVHLDQFRADKGVPRAWLFGIAANQLKSWLRKGQVDAR